MSLIFLVMLAIQPAVMIAMLIGWVLDLPLGRPLDELVFGIAAWMLLIIIPTAYFVHLLRKFLFVQRRLHLPFVITASPEELSIIDPYTRTGGTLQIRRDDIVDLCVMPSRPLYGFFSFRRKYPWISFRDHLFVQIAVQPRIGKIYLTAIPVTVADVADRLEADLRAVLRLPAPEPARTHG